jgi:hypothetical protein
MLESSERDLLIGIWKKMDKFKEENQLSKRKPASSNTIDNSIMLLANMKAALRALRMYGVFTFDNDTFSVLSLKEEDFGQPNFDLCAAIIKLSISESHLQYLAVLCFAKKGQLFDYTKKHMNDTGYSDSEFYKHCKTAYTVCESTVRRYIILFHLIKEYPGLAFCGENSVTLVKN